MIEFLILKISGELLITLTYVSYWFCNFLKYLPIISGPPGDRGRSRTEVHQRQNTVVRNNEKGSFTSERDLLHAE